MNICKYCNSVMYGETETLNRNSYRFFYLCPKCKSVYEGKMYEKKKEQRIIESRWYNPKEKRFE